MSKADRPVDVSRGLRKTAKAEEREPVEPYRPEELAGCIEGLWWYVARVAPQREFSVVDRLDQRQVFSFAPTRGEWRRWTRFDKKKTMRKFPAAPGYVIFGLSPDFPRWASVFACEGVLEVMGVSWLGYPIRLSVPDVDRVARICTEADDVERFMLSRAEYGVGDTVRVASGPYQGVTADVLAMEGAAARIMVEIFGAEREARIALDALEKVAS